MAKRRRKRKINKLKVIRFIIILLFLISLPIIVLNNPHKKELTKAKKETKEKIEPKEETTTKLSLIMVGDNLIHDSIYKEANKNANYNGYDFKPILEYIKPIVSKYDLAYYNQETILGGSEIGLSSYPAFNSPYEVGDAMIDTGFNLVSLATNHTLDRGEKAIINSRNYWDKQKDVIAAGSYQSEEDRNKIIIKEKNGIKYTLLNYTYGTNGIPIPNGKDYLVNIWPVTGVNPNNDIRYQQYKEIVKKDIENLKDKVDFLIVAMHWGIEYQQDANEYQKDAANYLVSLGVNLIVGTHPHVIQPVDYINNTLVIYSLGNFLSAHEVINMDNRVGLMTSLNVEKNSKKNKIEIKDVNNELLYTDYTIDHTNIKVIPFSNKAITNINDYKNIYEKYKKVVQKYNQNIIVKEIYQ
ncbi:MAG: CapA family protein [Bacilli bacterium]|nr:CapA family protein [Bacilli bacterium]